MKNTKKVRTLVLGYYGAKNMGDDMMLKAIVIWLKKQKRNVCVVSEDPLDTRQRFKVDTVLNVPLFLQWGWVNTILKAKGLALLKAIFSSDELLVGGGDLIRDNKGWGFFWYTMEKILFAKLLRKPVYLVGVGIARPTRRWSRFVLEYFLNRCQKIYVRDLESLELCLSMGLKNTRLMPDIATVLHTCQENKTQKNETPYCLVTLRYSPNIYGSFNVGEMHYKKLAIALDALIEHRGLRVVFNPYQKSMDNLEHKKVMHHMKNKQYCSLNEWDGDVMGAFALARNADLIIGMRLHSIIAGVCSNVRCIALPYDYKIEAFCQLAGVDEMIYPQDMLRADKLLEIMLRCLSKAPANKYPPASLWDGIVLG